MDSFNKLLYKSKIERVVLMSASKSIIQLVDGSIAQVPAHILDYDMMQNLLKFGIEVVEAQKTQWVSILNNGIIGVIMLMFFGSCFYSGPAIRKKEGRWRKDKAGVRTRKVTDKVEED